MFRRIRPSIRVIIPWLLLLGLLAGCVAPSEQATGGAAAPASGGEQAAPAPAGGRPLPADAAADQTLHYVTRNFNRLNPASEGGFGRPWVSFMWMTMFLNDREHNIRPWLATSYDVQDDGLTYIIHINPGAVWSDGSPVTAQEAIDYWTYGLSPKCTGCWLSYVNGFTLIEGAKGVIDGSSETVAGLTAVDEKTLQIKLESPSPTFINNLAHFNTGFMKMEDVGEAEFSAGPDTRVNGPFKIEEWDVDAQKHVIVQNPNWWGDTKPYLQKIIAQPSQDENVSFIMWQNDEVDVAHWLSNIRQPLRESEPDTFVQIPYATNFFFPLWTTLEPMDDINVRKALVHAVDWDAAINAAWEGARNDRIMKTHLTPELACYKADNWPDFGYNPDKAKEELAASKYGSADKLPKIRITVGGQSPNYIRTAEIIMEQWKNNLGITEVEMRPGVLKDAWGQEADQVQVRRSSWGATIPLPGDMVAGLYKWASDPANVGLVDEELAGMVEELRAVAPDAADYCTKVQAVENRLLGHYYFMPMIWDLYEYNVKPWVKNFDTNVDNNWTGLLDMYIAEH